jgi:hypothetical protein
MIFPLTIPLIWMRFVRLLMPYQLAQQFVIMVKKRQVDIRLTEAQAGPVVRLKTFAEGLRKDYNAVRAALEIDWSNGPVEGQVNRLKVIKCTRPAEVPVQGADAGQPTQNGLAERFIGILKQEHVDYAEYEDYDDAFRQLKHWLEVDYMIQRIHSVLDYLTPAEFEAMALGQPIPFL